MPVNLSSNLATPQPYIPIVGDGGQVKLAGVALVFDTAAALQAAVVVERSNIAAGFPIWKDNTPLQVSTEPAGRRWLKATGGDDNANAAASHAKTMVFANGKSVVLAGDANVGTTTTGIPVNGFGANGDVSVDWATSNVYLKTGGTWAITLAMGTPAPGTTITATSVLPASALGTITPVNSASATVQTLPSAAAAWASKPYGLVVLSQKGAGVPSFAAGGGDTLRATAGVSPCVQYGMCAAQVISATEWALA